MTSSTANMTQTKGLPRLSVPDQVIIGLLDLEGRPIRDAATGLEITDAACRQRHHRAKARLKKLLEADPRIAALTGAAALTGEDT